MPSAPNDPSGGEEEEARPSRASASPPSRRRLSPAGLGLAPLPRSWLVPALARAEPIIETQGRRMREKELEGGGGSTANLWLPSPCRIAAGPGGVDDRMGFLQSLGDGGGTGFRPTRHCLAQGSLASKSTPRTKRLQIGSDSRCAEQANDRPVIR